MVRPMQQNVAGQDWGEMFEIAILHSLPLARRWSSAAIPHGYHVGDHLITHEMRNEVVEELILI